MDYACECAKLMSNNYNWNYIDIFAGCGGLSTGLTNAGWTGLFAVEKNEDAFQTFSYNLVNQRNTFEWPQWIPMVAWDIDKLISQYQVQLSELKGQVTLVAGGPPCQGFSMAGKRDEKDSRNKLVKSYIEFVRLVLPEVLVFENVHGFTVEFSKNKKKKKYSSYIERELKKLGYKTKYEIINMADFGVPQNRNRFILIAMKNHLPKKVFKYLHDNCENFCKKKGINNNTTVREAISDLEKKHGVTPSLDSPRFYAGVYGNAESGYQQLMRIRSNQEKLAVDSHRFVNHRSEVLKLHNDLLHYAPIGKRITPKDNLIEGLKRRGVTVLDANSQTPTITSIPDELVHYSEPRILTVREHARIQSFPDWFEFKGKYTSGGKRRKQEVPRYTQVGNAIPPLFAEQLGLAIMEVLKNE